MEGVYDRLVPDYADYRNRKIVPVDTADKLVPAA